MNGYTFYALPLSPNASLFHPATLPSDEVAIAYAVAALKACPVAREVAVWKGWTFIARVNKDRAPA